MKVHSMTGHGRGAASFKDAKVIVELNSVNHRQFDLRLDLPPSISFMETEMRQIIHDAIARGSVSCRCHIHPGSRMATHQILIDQCLVRQCLRAARQTASNLKIPDDLGMSSLFGIPGMIKVVPLISNNQMVKKAVIDALRQALESLRSMRASEGRFLAGGIHRRLNRLNAMLVKIARRSPRSTSQYRRKLQKLLLSISGKENIDKKIFREIILLAERSDISEELERSRSHLRQMDRIMSVQEPVGRTLDFLVQEMLREINTIGSKANDCAISNLVIKYKTELECIREQVQNIE